MLLSRGIKGNVMLRTEKLGEVGILRILHNLLFSDSALSVYYDTFGDVTGGCLDLGLVGDTDEKTESD